MAHGATDRWRTGMTPVMLTRDVAIETVSREGTFCDTVQVPSGVGDMQLI